MNSNFIEVTNVSTGSKCKINVNYITYIDNVNGVTHIAILGLLNRSLFHCGSTVIAVSESYEEVLNKIATALYYYSCKSVR